MDDNIKEILKLLDEGKISSEEASNLIEKLKVVPEKKTNVSNKMDDVISYIKNLKLNEKANNIIEHPEVKSVIDVVKNAFEDIQTEFTCNHQFEKKYEIELDENVDLNLFAAKSNIIISRTINEHLFIKVKYKSRFDVDDVNLTVEENSYFFDFDKNVHNFIEYEIEVPEKYINAINIFGKEGKITFKNINLSCLINIELIKANISLYKVLFNNLIFNGEYLKFISKAANVEQIDLIGAEMEVTAESSDFSILTLKANSGFFNLKQSKTSFFTKIWNVNFLKGSVNIKLDKNKDFSKKVSLAVDKGATTIKLYKMKLVSKKSVYQDLEEPDYYNSPNKVFFGVTNLVGNVTIKN